jgi:hypothetical protein
MKKYNSRVKTILGLTISIAGLALLSSQAFAQTVIANWTFESLPSSGYSYTPGSGVSTTNFYADGGAQIGVAALTGEHTASPPFGTGTYSSPAGVGTGSARSLSLSGWTNFPGDYYQVLVSTVGYTNITLSFNQYSSGTGPRDFAVTYSTDGSIFTPFATYMSGNTVWTTNTFDLSSITALANASTVYIRLVDNSTNAANGTGIVGSGGTSRIDNVTVSGTVPGAPSIITQPQGVTNYFGDTASFTVVAGGNPTLSYRWYTNSTPLTALTDGSSGFGFGTIAGSTTNTLVLSYVNTNQTGNYRVVVSNLLGAVTSAPVHLQVNIRTPIVTNIAYLRALQDHVNWKPIDTTNLYSVTGIVTTPFNISGSGVSSEFFMQDGAAGICVFMGGGTYLPNAGDLVRVIGPVANFDGLLEFNLSASNPAHSISSAISTGNPLPAYKVFDIASIFNVPYMETNVEGSLVVVSNVFLDQSSLQFAAGAMNITNENRKYISFYVNGNSDVVGQNVPQFAASIKGVMSQYTTSTGPATNGYELDILQYSGLVPGTPPAIVMPLQIQRAGTNAVLTWWVTVPFTLQSAPSVTGTYTDIVGATTPFTNGVDSAAKFYRLKKN